MKRNKKDIVLYTIVVIVSLYVIIASTISRVSNPKWSETRHLIKMFYWGYQGE